MSALAVLDYLSLPKRWDFVLPQGVCLLSLDFMVLHNAIALVPSGFVSVIFLLASIVNVINACIFFGGHITPCIIIAGV